MKIKLKNNPHEDTCARLFFFFAFKDEASSGSVFKHQKGNTLKPQMGVTGTHCTLWIDIDADMWTAVPYFLLILTDSCRKCVKICVRTYLDGRVVTGAAALAAITRDTELKF